MPANEAWLARGSATPLALAEAAQRSSDNLAANVLLRTLGYPETFTAWLRAQGDAVTRVHRYEPAMNFVAAGDERDTTSTAAFAGLVDRLCADPGLKPASRARLVRWMRDTRTGTRRLRAGLPAAWRAGDKTGTSFGPGMPDRINDVAVLWPPGRAPWVLACLYEGPGSKAANGCASKTKRCWPRWGAGRPPSCCALETTTAKP